MIDTLVDVVLHLDRHLDAVIRQYGVWTYGVVFLIVFAETGFVVTPFLPGDSLLFAVGALAARGALDPLIAAGVLAAAAIGGDTVNYWIGQAVGPRVFHQERSRFFRREYLDRTHAFFERYGNSTIVLARFVPVVRTFAPFVAGIGRMSYGRFLTYNVAGGLIWVGLFVCGGFLFGNIPLVRQNFSLLVAAIIVVSVLPVAIEAVRHRAAGRRSSVSSADPTRRAGGHPDD